MHPLLALSLLAAPTAEAPASSGTGTPTAVTVTARATARILPGARIRLEAGAETNEHRFVDATVTVEDGSRRDAKLVEFQ